MKKLATIWAIMLLFAVAVTASAVYAQNEDEPATDPSDPAAQAAEVLAQLTSVQTLDKLPPYILLVAQRAVPSAQFSGFQWEMSDSLKPIYELQGMQDTKQLEIGIFLDGSIDRINRTITMSDVPIDVVGMLDKYVGDFEVTNVTEATLANGVHRFEFAGRSGGINLAVEIADSAKQIRIVELN